METLFKEARAKRSKSGVYENFQMKRIEVAGEYYVVNRVKTAVSTADQRGRVILDVQKYKRRKTYRGGKL